jgi:hypothetical protein
LDSERVQTKLYSNSSARTVHALRKGGTSNLISEGTSADQSNEETTADQSKEKTSQLRPAKVDRGDFVLVSFDVRKRKRNFVGHVLDVDGDQLNVDFLRRGEAVGGRTFVYPEHQDTAWVDEMQVIQKLPVPKVDSRNHLTFPEMISAE